MKSRLVKITCSLLLAVCFLAANTLPVQADDPMALVLGGEGSSSWTIGDVRPGDTGSKTVTLLNDSSKLGIVTIWISAVAQGEGTNPEPESGNLSEPGELGKYLYLGCSGSGMRTNIAMPSTLDGFPSSIDGSRFIRVYPLEPGETAEVTWNWEFRETGESQNDAMGDFLSFTINYLLEEMRFIPDAPDDGGDLIVDVMGSPTDIKVSSDGVIRRTAVASSLDHLCQILLERGVKVAAGDGRPIQRIIIREHPDEVLPPHDAVLIGSVYDVVGYADGNETMDMVFEPAVKLTIRYAPEWLPVNTKSLDVRQYQAAAWLPCGTPPGNTGMGGNAVLVSTGGTYALLAGLAPQDLVADDSPLFTPDAVPEDNPDSTRSESGVEQGLSAPVDEPLMWLAITISVAAACVFVMASYAIVHHRKARLQAGKRES